MRLPSLQTFIRLPARYPDTLLRQLFIVVVALLTAVFLVAVLFFFTTHNPFKHTENNILDLLLRFRAEHHAPPSEDIVFLAFDLPTIQYARAHPELGIGNRFLPRSYLGKVTDYLNKQGVKGVVFDVEFDDGTTPENDKPLADALKGATHGNVTLALRADVPWNLYYPWADKKEEAQALGQEPQNARYYRWNENLSLFLDFYMPRLLIPRFRLNQVFERANPQKTDPFLFTSEPLSYRAFLSHPDPTRDVLIPPTVQLSLLNDAQNHALNAYVLRNEASEPYQYYRDDTLRAQSPDEMIYQRYEQGCLVDIYEKYYPGANHPFLQQLLKDSLAIHFPSPPSRKMRSKYTYCYANPIHPQFLASDNVHLGISSIVQDKDAFMRDIPFLYRSYQGTYHTYIGIRPALQYLKPKRISYTPETLTLDEREIPLVDQRDIIINWRDPRNLIWDILNQSIGPNFGKELRRKYLNTQYLRWSRLNNRLSTKLSFEYFPSTSMAPFFTRGAPVAPEEMMALERLWRLYRLSDRYYFASNPAEKEKIEQEKAYLLFKTLDLFGVQDVGIRVKNKKELREENVLRLLGGHLYRKISVIDVLKEIGLAEKNKDEKIYRLQNLPISGEFSFKDKIVIYGDAVKDVHQTPMGVVYGPEIVATAIDMIINDREFVRFTPGFITFSVVLLWLALIFGAMVTIRSIYLAVGLALAAIVAYWMLAVMVFFQYLYVTPFILPSGAMIVGLILSTVYRYYIQEYESRQLTSAFSKYVSPQLMDEIVANPATAMENLKGSKKELTVLFSDLRNFTSTFEDKDPEIMVEQLNEYFDVMTEIIISNNGTYDKYMGDAIMAFFGAPADFPDHAFKACKSAIEMREALKQLNSKWKAQGKSELNLGVGLSTGQMFVGNFGSQRIKNFTVMGSTVNLGARLEAYTRQAGMTIVISENTVKQAGDNIQVKELGFISVKGFSEPIEVYGLQDLSEPSMVDLGVVERILDE